jgi:hypothetical protein
MIIKYCIVLTHEWVFVTSVILLIVYVYYTTTASSTDGKAVPTYSSTRCFEPKNSHTNVKHIPVLIKTHLPRARLKEKLLYTRVF